MELQKRTQCTSCGRRALVAPAVCTLCGEPLIVSSIDGQLSVVVEPIPSLQRRQEVARDLAGWLEVEDHHGLADRLGRSKVSLGGELSPAAAGRLRDALALRKAPATVSSLPGADRGWGKALTQPIGLAALGLGVLLGFVTMGLGCLAGAVAYALIAAFALKKGQPEVVRAPMTLEALEGWEEFAPAFTRLMGRLEEQPRQDLARLATAVAEIQADLQGGGMIAYASGGQQGRFASSVRAMLDKGVAAGRAVENDRPGAQDALRRVADAAQETSQRVDALVEGGRGADPAGLIATLDSALNEAEAVVKEVTLSQVETTR